MIMHTQTSRNITCFHYPLITSYCAEELAPTNTLQKPVSICDLLIKTCETLSDNLRHKLQKKIFISIMHNRLYIIENVQLLLGEHFLLSFIQDIQKDFAFLQEQGKISRHMHCACISDLPNLDEVRADGMFASFKKQLTHTCYFLFLEECSELIEEFALADQECMSQILLIPTQEFLFSEKDCKCALSSFCHDERLYPYFSAVSSIIMRYTAGIPRLLFAFLYCLRENASLSSRRVSYAQMLPYYVSFISHAYDCCVLEQESRVFLKLLSLASNKILSGSLEERASCLDVLDMQFFSDYVHWHPYLFDENFSSYYLSRLIRTYSCTKEAKQAI